MSFPSPALVNSGVFGLCSFEITFQMLVHGSQSQARQRRAVLDASSLMNVRCTNEFSAYARKRRRYENTVELFKRRRVYVWRELL